MFSDIASQVNVVCYYTNFKFQKYYFFINTFNNKFPCILCLLFLFLSMCTAKCFLKKFPMPILYVLEFSFIWICWSIFPAYFTTKQYQTKQTEKSCGIDSASKLPYPEIFRISWWERVLKQNAGFICKFLATDFKVVVILQVGIKVGNNIWKSLKFSGWS